MMSPYERLASQNLEENKAIIESTFALVKKEIPSLINVSLEITNDINNGGFFYYVDEENNTLTDPKIVVAGFNRGNKTEFDYTNKTFGINLKNDVKTALIFITLHEIGHYIDDINQEDFMAYMDKMESYYKEVYKIKNYTQQIIAYRQVPCEYEADKFAVEFMTRHYPELI